MSENNEKNENQTPEPVKELTKAQQAKLDKENLQKEEQEKANQAEKEKQLENPKEDQKEVQTKEETQEDQSENNAEEDVLQKAKELADEVEPTFGVKALNSEREYYTNVLKSKNETIEKHKATIRELIAKLGEDGNAPTV